MTAKDLKEGDVFRLANGQHFATTKTQGDTRKILWLEDTGNGMVTICATHGLELYTIPANTEVELGSQK